MKPFRILSYLFLIILASCTSYASYSTSNKWTPSFSTPGINSIPTSSRSSSYYRNDWGKIHRNQPQNSIQQKNNRNSVTKDPRIIELVVKFETFSAPTSPDGVAKQIITINGMFPGPTIRAKIGDTLIIRVHNRLLDNNGTKHETSVHYHGIEMKLEPWMDGPEQVTQCPIPYGNHMDYKFTLHQSGSYWYHSHHQWQYIDGFWGWLIVDNMPENMVAYSHGFSSILKDVHPYDDELVISLMDWYWKTGDVLTIEHNMSENGSPNPDSYLINGKGSAKCQIARNGTRPHVCDERRAGRAVVFNVIAHYTYRIRLLNPSAKASFTFAIDGHKMWVIEVDGVDTTLGRPVDVITLWPAQRYSVLVTMKPDKHHHEDNYRIRVDMIVNGNKSTTAHVNAVLHYLSEKNPQPACTRVDQNENRRLLEKIQNGRKQSKGGGKQGRPCDNTVPWRDQAVNSSMPTLETRSSVPRSRPVLMDCDDKGETHLDVNCLKVHSTPPKNLVILDQEWCDPVIVRKDGTHDIETAPMDVHHTVTLNMTIPGNDWLVNGRPYSTHNQKLPAIFRVMSGQDVPVEFRPHYTELGHTVQIVMNNLNPVSHPYHLHGHTYYVMGTGEANDGAFNPTNPNHIRKLNDKAMRRDTTHTLPNSWSVVRIITNNPGVWILHCHIHWHLDKGLAAVFVEGARAQQQRYKIPDEARRVCKLNNIDLPNQNPNNF